MSYPRQVLPGATYLVTRRCTQRQFLIRPSEQTNGILLYCLAGAAALYGIEVHAYCFLSNHYHLVVTDPMARLPEFMRYLNEHVARALNASLGRWESLWAPGSYSAVRLVAAEDVIAKIAYTLANPVAAGLVERAEHWPGVWSHPRELDGPSRVVLRPEGGFFRPRGPAPEVCELRLTRPPGFADRATYVDAARQELRAHENAAVLAMRARGGAFLGRRGILVQSVTEAPATVEPRRGLSPRIAARDRWKRIEALLRLRDFIEAYRAARDAMRAGLASVLFPLGTYWLRIHQRVACDQG